MNKDQNVEYFKIIYTPIVTDKTTKLLEKNQYCFRVNPKVNKTKIKQAIEFIFKVKVTNINTCHEPKKRRKVGRFHGYRTHYKKAIITLLPGNTINLFSDQ